MRLLLGRRPSGLEVCALAGMALAGCSSASAHDESGDASVAASSDSGANGPNPDAAGTPWDAAGSQTDDGAGPPAADASADFDAANPATCNQSLADKSAPPATTSFIVPTRPVTPFYQWESNNGYCGETALIQAGLNNGQWISQFNARLLCGAESDGSDGPAGTPLLQSGPDGGCDPNAQMQLDDSSPARAPLCLSNYALQYQTYDYTTAATGMPGYESFLSWVKARTIAGDTVAVGVLDAIGSDTEYDHIVSVLKIGTNHATTDSTYYADDVLYFDDHGLLTFEGTSAATNPAIPPGTGPDTAGCTPYVYGYSFGALAATSTQAHAAGARAYSIVIPATNAQNYGFAVSGPVVSGASDEALPVALEVTGTTTGGNPNPEARVVRYGYENPYVGTSDDGDSCTNAPPSSWMTLSLQVTVSGLTAGTSYNLYEYDFPSVTGVGSAAALAIPTSSFNANAKQATFTTPFVASGPSYAYGVPPRVSSQTIVFRAVPASAP